MMKKQAKESQNVEGTALKKAVRPPRKKDFLVRYVSQKTGFSISYVTQVRNGTRSNEQIMAELVDARERFKEALV